MNNQAERKAFEALIQYRQFLGRHKDGTYELEWVEGRWQGWQLRAAYQREQVKGLVEALDGLIAIAEGRETKNAWITVDRAREALAAYRAEVINHGN